MTGQENGQPAPSVGVRLDREGPVATVTLCRPDVLNAQTPAMWAALRDFARELPGDVRVVVVRGEGRAFSAGLDLSVAGALASGGEAAGGSAADERGTADRVTGAGDSSAPSGTFVELVSLPPEQAQDRIALFQEGFSWLRRPDLITIAAVQGHAIGAGFQLALACDFRVVTDDATFTMAEVSLGLVPDLTGTKRLVELVGYARALEICVTGRRVPAAEAERIGLANLVVGRADLDAAVADLTAAVLSAPRDAVVEIKALIAGAAWRGYAEQEEAERAAQIRRLRDLAGVGE
ncbi:enoyl-CoA hydratase/isomerase family protein [Planosporangium flavigriseum]|uniref:Enoyl-CoA hydratase n=1 Tax=Planosporangium flavigriseum TaxID=373681 RepID=A0A8J3LTI1_9ACTN|nr:enoyl-CoA hydratase/isomerase family protein [Planosporangium flavigriseum]NJC65348.1 enoyl-CoA hydratase/isomerase family protein [Planosporangium flavigriseum]GIG73296.1 enoyl-CoA hydratase [Planosporangium flavigriseum]